MTNNDGQTSEPRSLPEEAEAPAEKTGNNFFVVGIGASAGGLEALEGLVRNLVFDGMAYIVVQHLARTHESALPALLARASTISVVAAGDGMKVERNRIYVIPPNSDLAIAQGTLHLREASSASGVRLPIDFFFRSLAEDQGSRAIGIVLSGTGSDGTFGLKAIKQAGGLTFAQDPASAKYDGMPRAALESGWADASLTPPAIADELMRIGRHPYLAAIPRHGPQGKDGVAKLAVLIRAAFGNDITNYKTNTIERRIARRMALRKVEHLDQYVELVQSNAEELRLLHQDMLIGVTSFFRDREPFEALKARVFPRILEGKPPGSSIRVWVPACSSGEEAYSIAMCLLEYLGQRAADFRIQIFGTDIDESAVQEARRGVYPPNIALDVSPERLHRFFSKYDHEYQINRSIRDLLVFSFQNVTKDPPFSRLDLVSCRNLLIYLQPSVQKKVMRVLHYALNSGGYLMLGSSETVGDSPSLFSVFDQKAHVYAPKHQGAHAMAETGFSLHTRENPAPMQPSAHPRPAANLASMADRKILDLYGPPGVVINENLEVLHFRGNTGPYLGPAPGAASLNILRLARTEIHADLRRVVYQALTENKAVGAPSRIHEGSEIRDFRIEVLPMTEPDTKTRCLLVLFHEARQEESEATDDVATGGAISPADQRNHDLEQELIVAKEYLQNTIEELESANEELKSSNEELQSSNEELQSTNEELETSKEEMQSTNEELSTVNDELKARMAELQETYDDLHNVMTGVDNAVVIAGMDLRVRRFTHAAEQMLNLVPGDVGRPVGMLNPFVGGEKRIEQITSDVIASLQPFDERIQASDHCYYRLRVIPYRTVEHTIKGAVVILSNIDVAARATELAHDVAEYASKFLQAIHHPLMIINGKLRIVWANEAFFTTFQLDPEEVVGSLSSTLKGGPGVDPTLTSLLASTASTGTPFRNADIRCRVRDVDEQAMKVSANRIPAMAGESILVLVSFEEDHGLRPSSDGRG
jgi:two-component system CheB/CheR fusion protein